EETGREERYRFFRSLGADLVLTAHHKDDQAETVLLHLLRGCGLAGLCGMEPCGGDLARPFLCVTKEEILSYCERNGLGYKNDLSNEDTVYTRNRIRKEVIPLMKEINPNITESLWRLSQNAVADECFLDDRAAEVYRRSRDKKDDILCLKISADFDVDLAVARRMIRMAAEECGVSADFDHTERILALTNGKRLPLSEDVWVCRYADCYTFGPRPKMTALAEETALSVGGTVVFGDHIIESKFLAEQVKGNVDSLGVFDRELFDDVPVIRTRRNGDYVVLPNGKKKKLSDYFIDEKIPSSERDAILLLATDDRVLWVVGHRFFAPKGQENLIVNISVKS
ncbi:MAG: tRNA lysidine(34) synthetase TilS, partial [Firmicutes bacterium]|nr:tRNA lysidine(34) synthetase TilS [Bacillota bacterium]